MSARDLKATILPGLLSGARNGLPLEKIGAGDALQALSLTAQALRFDRPAPPRQFDVEEKVVDDRPIVALDLRKLLLRLLTPKNRTSLQAARVAHALSAANLRLYPLHLPLLDEFVRAHAEILGPEALAYAQREAPAEQKQNYFAPDQLTDETWMLATPAVRARYIMDRRVSDPAIARALVEAVWTTENADNRLRLLGAIREHLSEADQPFLAGLAKDRAPRVRELAQRLLARLPGFEGDNPALRNVLERIKAGKTGLVFKKPMLTLELPATVHKSMAAAWIRENFAGVGLDELARALSMTVGDMIEAAHKDAPMIFACFIMATEEKRFDAIDTIVRHITDIWDSVAASGLDELPAYTQSERIRWADIVVQPKAWTADTSFWNLTRLAQLLDGPVSDELMKQILNSKPWTNLLKDFSRLNADMIDTLSVLCPPAMRPTLRSHLAVIEPAKTGNAILFLDVMDKLETTHA
jgi:hypothetical protein